MMSLKFSRIAKVTRDLTGRRPASPPADDDFEVYLLILQSYRILSLLKKKKYIKIFVDQSNKGARTEVRH